MPDSRDVTAGSSVTSTEAQNNFGEVLSRASREGRVFITRYRRPEAVVLSMEAYAALVGEEPVDLESLEQEFQVLVTRMQTGGHSAAVDALFEMTTEELGQAAVQGVRADTGESV